MSDGRDTRVVDALLGNVGEKAEKKEETKLATAAEKLKAAITKHKGDLRAVAVALECHRVTLFRTITRLGVRDWLDATYPQKPGPRAAAEPKEAKPKAARKPKAVAKVRAPRKPRAGA
jgi:hypothetical protein